MAHVPPTCVSEASASSLSFTAVTSSLAASSSASNDACSGRKTDNRQRTGENGASERTPTVSDHRPDTAIGVPMVLSEWRRRTRNFTSSVRRTDAPVRLDGGGWDKDDRDPRPGGPLSLTSETARPQHATVPSIPPHNTRARAFSRDGHDTTVRRLGAA